MSDGPSFDLTFTTVPDDDTPPVTFTITQVQPLHYSGIAGCPECLAADWTFDDE